MQNPRGISVSPDGSTVILVNSENERIDFFSASTLAYEIVDQPGGVTACGGKKMYFPHQAAFDAANNSYWVADTNNKRILDLSSTGTCLANWTDGGAIKAPRGIAWDGTNVWVADAQTGEILKCTTAGSCTVVAKKSGTPTKVKSPWNLTIANGDLYIADEGAAEVVVMNLATHTPVYTFGTPGTTRASANSARRGRLRSRRPARSPWRTSPTTTSLSGSSESPHANSDPFGRSRSQARRPS